MLDPFSFLTGIALTFLAIYIQLYFNEERVRQFRLAAEYYLMRIDVAGFIDRIDLSIARFICAHFPEPEKPQNIGSGFQQQGQFSEMLRRAGFRQQFMKEMREEKPLRIAWFDQAEFEKALNG